MAISSPGLGSGLDVNNIVSQLMAVERRPLTALDSKEATIQAKISALGSLLGAISGVQSASASLKGGSFTNFAATVTDTAIATASAAAITPDSYELEVTQLAQVQIKRSNTEPAFVDGTLTLTVGSNSPVNLTLSGVDALATNAEKLTAVAAAINADSAFSNLVTASVDGTQLVLTANDSGSANTITLGGAAAAAVTTTIDQAALNASFKLDGTAYSRASNRVSDAITGVVLNLAATNVGSPTTLTVEQDSVDIGNTAVASVSTLVAQGSYTLSVTKLAQAQIITTSSSIRNISSSGTISISVAGATGVDIAVTAGSSLSTVAANINADSTLKTKIRASVVDNKLVLESLATGANNTIAISSATLTAFAATSVARAAQDAEFSINGLTLNRPTNTVTDALDGITLNLLGTQASGVSTKLTVGRSVNALKASLDSFIKTYNEANATVRDLGKYDAATKQGSILTGDATLRTAQSQLRTLQAPGLSGLSDPFANAITQLGIKVARDGSLSLDSGKLNALYSERPGSTEKLAKAFGTVAEKLTKALTDTAGLVSSRVNGLNASIDTLGDRRDLLTRRLEQVEARFRRQFTSLDSLVSNLQKTSSFLTQQLANLPKSGG